MDEEREEEFLKLVSYRGTRTILQYMDSHDTAQHADLDTFMNTATLNMRLSKLLEFDLIEHHLDKKGVRREWYTITEKGRKILNHLEEMIIVIKD